MLFGALLRTRISGWRVDDGLRTRKPDATKLFLVTVPLPGNAQEALTHEERCCESRRKLMFSHFFACADCNSRTSPPESISQSTSCDGLWMTHVGSRVPFWALLSKSNHGPKSGPVVCPGGTRSTSVGAPASPRVTARIACAPYESGAHTVTRALVGSESLRAEFDGKGRGCL